MNKFISPLKPRMQEPSVAGLQETIQFILGGLTRIGIAVWPAVPRRAGQRRFACRPAPPNRGVIK